MTDIQSILTKYILGEASPDEACKVELWLSQSISNQKEFQRLWKTIEITFQHERYQLPNTRAEWAETRLQLRKLRSMTEKAHYSTEMISGKGYPLITITSAINAILVLMVSFNNLSDTITFGSANKVIVQSNKQRSSESIYKRESSNRLYPRHPPIKESSLDSHILDFKDTPLHEVLIILEKDYKVRFQFTDLDIRDCRITSRFENKSLEEILDIIAYTLKLEYKSVSGTDKIIIIGDKCE
ncbi:DUF4974 domain-containing protein [Dyadobacter aurulentus]|uniref:DUF4974 domain-containing protein n=1 Tax=Dyadobacter sp. UC 10 TaxID=2605428 RepID=UPI0011F36047|nr:DUF4974 domain-containing protein [Dyadobacter sp. UC 10]KAA0990719.1 DUF4974 domain-containing protein [Dyadobacter sp. UC 10]